LSRFLRFTGGEVQVFMSAVTSLVSLLAMPVPAWIALIAIAGLYAVNHVTLVRRLNSHARSLGHMDRWADSVEARLEELAIETGLETAPPPPPVKHRKLPAPANDRPRQPVDIRTMSDRQVRALLSRLVGERAA
jgi:hypothetical protein